MKIFTLIFGCMFMLIALYTGFTGVKSAIQEYRAKHWLVTSGEITKVIFMDATDTAGTTDYNYEYIYRINDVVYTGDREHFGLGINTNEHTITYKEGEKVEVYYDPEQPHEAVLRRNDSNLIFTSIVFLAFFSVGAWLIVSVLQKSFQID